MQPLLTVQEVADSLQLDVQVVARLVFHGELPAYHIGDQYRFDRKAVEAYLQARSTATRRRRSRTKYDGIADMLDRCQQDRVTYSFATLEQAIGAALPYSAYNYRAWWANTSTSHPHARSWLDNGWEVAAVDQAKGHEQVTFDRVSSRGRFVTHAPSPTRPRDTTTKNISIRHEEEEMMPFFELTLHSAYYSQGFFNVPVAFDRFVRSSDGPITLALGNNEQTVAARVNRRANPNGTARIMGGTKLRDWFQGRFDQGDTVSVVFRSPELIHIGDS